MFDSSEQQIGLQRKLCMNPHEEFQLYIVKNSRFLYLAEGEIEVTHNNKTQVINHTRSTYPFAITKNEPIKIKAIEESILYEVDAEAVDELISWNAISSSLNSNELVERANKVRNSPSFRRLPVENLQAALEKMQLIKVQAEETIMQQGEAGNSFFLIEQGKAQVWQTGLYDDEPQLVAELASGDCFGEEALVTGGTRSATVKMLSDGKLLRLDKNDYHKYIAGSMVKEVNAKLAKAMLDDDYQLLDVRYEEEFEESYIPSCRLIPLHELRCRFAELDKSKKYIVYCRSGRRSAIAAILLKQEKIDALSLSGGIKNWPFETASKY